MQQRRFAMAWLAAAALLAASCGGGGGGDSDEAAPASSAAGGQAQPSGPAPKIRMGWGIPGDELKYQMLADSSVAPNLGRCYTLEWTQLASSAQGVQSLAAGTLDASTVGALAAANAIEQGTDIVLVGEYLAEKNPNFSTTWMVKNDSPIRSAADLRDKTVGTSGIGNPTNYLQEFYIEDQGGLVANRDYKVVELPYPQQEEALASGRIDLGVFAQPFYGRAAASGQFRPLFKATDVQDNFAQLLQGFRRDYVNDHRDAVKCFVDDLVAVNRYVADPANRPKVIANTAQATKIPPEVLERFSLTQNDYYRPANAAIDLDSLQRTWDFFQKRGGITGQLKARDHVVDGLLPPGA